MKRFYAELELRGEVGPTLDRLRSALRERGFTTLSQLDYQPPANPASVSPHGEGFARWGQLRAVYRRDGRDAHGGGSPGASHLSSRVRCTVTVRQSGGGDRLTVEISKPVRLLEKEDARLGHASDEVDAHLAAIVEGLSAGRSAAA